MNYSQMCERAIHVRGRVADEYREHFYKMWRENRSIPLTVGLSRDDFRELYQNAGVGTEFDERAEIVVAFAHGPVLFKWDGQT